MASVVVDQVVLNAQSVLGQTSMPIARGSLLQLREMVVYVEFGDKTTGGQVTVEAAYTQAYPGTWAKVATIDWDGDTQCQCVQVTGVHGALRARISKAILGGTVTVKVIGN